MSPKPAGQSGIQGTGRRFADRGPQAIAVLATLSVLVLLWLAVFNHLSERREEATGEARRDVSNISVLVSDHVSRIFGNTDQILRLMQADYADDPEKFDFTSWTRLTVSLEHTALQIAMFDASGDLIASKVPVPGPGRVNVGDRDYFRRLAEPKDPGLVVGRTMMGRVTARWVLQLARRIERPDHTFAGAIIISLDPEYIAQRFSAMDIGPDGTIALTGYDGYVRTRIPAVTGMYDTPAGRIIPQANSLFRQLQVSPWGMYEAPAGSDGVARVYGYKALDGYPLVVDVGKSLAGVYATYNSERVRAFTISGAATAAVLGGLGFVLFGMERRRRRDGVLAAARNAAADSDARYRALADAMPQLVWVMRAPDGSTTYVNRGYEDYFGQNGRHHDMEADRVHPADAQRYLGFWNEAQWDGSAREIEVRLRRTDGEHRWHKVVATPLRSSGGATVGWLGTALDIDEIVAGRQALQQATDLLRIAQDGAGAGTWNMDLRTGRILLSENSARLHGLSGDAPLDVHETEWARMVNADDAAACLAMVRAAAAAGEPYEGEFRVSTPAGERWIQGIGRTYYDADGSPRRMIGLNFDATHRKAAETILVEAKAEAERASAAKTDFLAAMSHEIRTPLNAMLGFTGLLAEWQGLPPEQKRHADLARSAGESLLTVVNDILDFSKVEAGAIELDPRPFMPASLVDNCVSIVRGGISDAVTIRTELDPRLPRALSGDEGRLRQILLNLLNNAVKFTPEGSVTVEVAHEGAADGLEWIRFAVRDTGIGIPADRRDRIFRRFSQVDGSTSRRFGGTGLGLAICRSLVEAMGGEIGFESEEGKGSTFWFALALPRAIEPGAGVGSVPVPASARPGTILVAEDVPVNQELVRTILEAAGHRVVLAGDGQEALAAIERGAPDLVLMDVRMPVVDGLEATRRIRSRPDALARLPILAMTANVLPSEVARIREAGMDGHVGKPFDAATLILEVDRLLAGDPAPSPTAAPPSSPGTDNVIRMLGPAKAQIGLMEVARQCRASFRTDPGTPAGRDAIRADAHALVSAAGMFGFAALSAASAEVDRFVEARVLAEGPAPFEEALRAARTLAEETAATAERIAADLQRPSAEAG